MMKNKSALKLIRALVSDADGNIFELDGYAAVGMSGKKRVPLRFQNTQALPFGSELMMLPDRSPIVFDPQAGRMVVLHENPHRAGQRLFPVAAFNSPGYVISHICAYAERQENVPPLPLFAYGAVGWGRGGFRSAAICVDREKRQDLRYMKREDVIAGVKRMQKQLPRNRLRRHLETCALTYGCPAGKNFFLQRFEAPLPTSPTCNAHCLGCISLQDGTGIPSSQNRIAFTPSPQEICEVATTHIAAVNRAVVSFGQGCEGDPLLVGDVLEAAIGLIRQTTDAGTINVNTNGSRTATVKKLCDAGLDSIRISINSLRPDCYHAYFRPRNYRFEDVCNSIDAAGAAGKFVSINYLNLAGFTDCEAECRALEHFLGNHPVHMIQWRNLNFDPRRYLQAMDAVADNRHPIGMKTLITRIHRRFPALRHGYFNPPRECFQ